MEVIVAMRGRDTENPNYRGPSNENFQQKLEPNSEGISNTITTVQKDNLVLESEQVGTAHWPHGWCKSKADFSGVAPTIDAGISEQHTMLIEQRKVLTDTDNEERLSRAEQSSCLIRQATKKGCIQCNLPGIADLEYPTSLTRRGRVIDQGNTCPTLTTESIPSVLEQWTWEIDGVTYLIRIRKLTPRECWRLMDFTDEDFDEAQKVNSNTQLYKQAGNSIVKNVLCELFKAMI